MGRETANTEAETQKTEGLSPEQKGWYRELQTIRSEQGEDAAKAWVRENPMPETQAEREQTERATTELVADYYGEREAELYSRAVEAEAAELTPGKDRRPGTEHSGNVTMPSGYVGTEATAKLGIEVEAPITDLWNVERVRNADRQSREMERQIADYIRKKEASPLEIRRAKAVAAGEEKLENYRFTMHEPGNRKHVVEELAGLYRMQRDSDSGIALRDNIRQAREDLGVRIEEHLPDEVLSKAKPPVRTSLWTNTWRRNNLRTFGREAGTWVNEQFFDTAVRNEAGRIRWANGQLEELRFAEQLTDGENELVFRILDGEANIENAESGMDRALVQKTVDAMRQKYADYYDAINDFLAAHGYKEIGFIENYAPHMQPDSVKEQARIFDRLGFGEEVSGIPTEIAGRTRDFKPGKKYNPFFQERKGVNAKADAVESFNSYINYLSEVFYHTDDIQKLRVLENEIRARYSPKSVQTEYEALKKNKNLSTEERDARIDELLHGKAKELGKFGGYVTQLENYTNILAGKQTKMDRAIEDHITRNALNTMRKPVDILVRSSIPGNLSSAINQLVQLPQLTAEVGEKNILRAAEDLRTGRLRDIGIDLDGESTFLTGKKGIRRLVQSEKTLDKILDTASIPFEAVDDLASRLYVRAAYFQALDQGMKHEDAVRAADRTVEDIIGSRMKGAKPNSFADKNIVSKLVNTFQLEVANGWEHIKYDLPQQWKETARTQGKQAAQAEQSGGNAASKYSLKRFDQDGRRYVDVEADQNIFDGLSEREMGKLATSIIKSRFAGRVIGIDNKAFVNGVTATEYGFPAKRLTADLHEAKMRASTELDNLLDAGTNFRTKPDGADGHVHPKAVGDFRYFDTTFKVGNEYYSGVVNILPVSKGLLLKDITKIKNITEDIRSSYGDNPKSTFLRDVSIEIVHPEKEDVKKLSLKKPVEETDKLLALHNKDENSILAALDLGGLPMPSIAVVKARDGHSKYGPISLVFNKDTIDPQRSSANKVYGGDAWTPTAPRVDYPVNRKKASQLEHELHRLAGDTSVAGGIFGNSAALRSMGIDDTSTRNTTELAEKLASTDTVRAAKPELLEPDEGPGRDL